jgi:uncharacterized Zn-binding protein involved in type VI secretion
MPLIQEVGDPNTGGGLVETPPQTFFKCNGILVSVDTTDVTDHPPDHVGVQTANGSSFLRIDGKRVNIFGNADTCGHTRAGSQVSWFNIQS